MTTAIIIFLLIVALAAVFFIGAGLGARGQANALVNAICEADIDTGLKVHLLKDILDPNRFLHRNNKV